MCFVSVICFVVFFFSIRRRHTRCALVTGVQTCALPISSRYFVPFYRRMNEISAYTHLEHRFGAWARTYAVLCFLFTQIARIGSIFFGMALAIQALTGYSMIGKIGRAHV